jgi:glutamyl-tRNA synthetase
MSLLIPLQFTMKFTKGETVVTLEKLWYLQRAHAERYASSDTTSHGAKMSLMTEPILEILKERNGIDRANRVLGHHNAKNYVTELVQLDARNYTNASAFVERNKYFFQTPDEQALLSSRPSGHLHYVPTAISAVAQDEVLHEVLAGLELIPSEKWTKEKLRDCINAIITERAEQSLKSSKNDHVVDLETIAKAAPKSWSKLIHGYVRWAIAAGLPGPDGAASMQILGKEETLARLAKAARVLKIEHPDGDLDTKVTEAHRPTRTSAIGNV